MTAKELLAKGMRGFAKVSKGAKKVVDVYADLGKGFGRAITGKTDRDLTRSWKKK